MLGRRRRSSTSRLISKQSLMRQPPGETRELRAVCHPFGELLGRSRQTAQTHATLHFLTLPLTPALSVELFLRHTDSGPSPVSELQIFVNRS
jgi:hypothetical protein